MREGTALRRRRILDARGRGHDACFSSMPAAPRRLASDQFHNLRACQIPWSQGKMQGISPNSADFPRNLFRKHLRIQRFAKEFPTRTEQGIFLPAQGINNASRESAGNFAQNRPARPDASDWVKCFSFADKKVINSFVLLPAPTDALGFAERAALQCRCVQGASATRFSRAIEAGAQAATASGEERAC